ncbi:MAG: hypothetical protein WCI47_03575 [bacterium]
MVYGPSLKKKTNSRPIAIVLLLIVVVGVGGFLAWRSLRKSSKITGQGDYQANAPQTSLGNESKRDDSANNTSQQNEQLAQSSNSPSQTKLPTPILSKSSGNNGSVPVDAVIEYICTAPAGYNCKIIIKGSRTITLTAKAIEDNGRGQAAASWTWVAEKGSWSITAVLSDNKGNEQASTAQTLEVK